MEKLQVVPTQLMPEVAELHPLKADPALAVAVSVPTSLLPRFGEQVVGLADKDSLKKLIDKHV